MPDPTVLVLDPAVLDPMDIILCIHICVLFGGRRFKNGSRARESIDFVWGSGFGEVNCVVQGSARRKNKFQIIDKALKSSFWDFLP